MLKYCLSDEHKADCPNCTTIHDNTVLGWMCPRCGQVWAWWVDRCGYCTPHKGAAATTDYWLDGEDATP